MSSEETKPKRAKAKKIKLDDLAGHDDPKHPLDAAALLAAAAPLLSRLEVDLRARAAASPAVTLALTAQYEAEKAAERTAESFVGWSNALATQVAASWLLSCVFVRTLEDRGLLRQNRIAGPGALDSQRQFFQLAPSLTERDYLLMVFRELAKHPAARDLFDLKHSLVWKLSPSAELAKTLLALFRAPNADAPAFRFGQASTRFLGDLYQDISEDVRKRYALLQTPDFVEAFILDRTLEPAITRFGLDDTTVIDPTCGSGHFLLGSFDRLFEHRLLKEPGIDRRQAAVKALDAVYGADINPYAVAIARFRLTLSFLDKAGYGKLADAPALPLHLVVADSLLHGVSGKQGELGSVGEQSAEVWTQQAQFALEDEAAARDVLRRHFAAVVGNPPYITEKDPAKRELYRKRYVAAAGKYALSAPFCERFFQLARSRGYVGQITANSFMKREFGKRLIEEVLPGINLDLIVNTSGAYIPGHGTPTVLLFGTSEPPVEREVLAVLGKRGEPSTPADPSKGLVWSSIAGHWSDVGFDDDYITVAKVERAGLSKHPWSLGGGGAGELKELLEERAEKRLGQIAEDIGFASFTGLDEAFMLPPSAAYTLGLEPEVVRPFVVGESVRDWGVSLDLIALAPYDHATHESLPYSADSRWGKFLWRYRTVLGQVLGFGGRTRAESGENWWEWYRWQKERYACAFRISFAEVATHNHFVLDRGGKVFKQTAPIIKLPASATEDDHLALLAYLNSSTACFLVREVCQNKGGQGINEGLKSEAWEQFIQRSGTALGGIPIVDAWHTLAPLGRSADAAAQELSRLLQEAEQQPGPRRAPDDTDVSLERRALDAFHRLVALQERIDWEVYRLGGLLDESIDAPSIPDRIRPGCRAFEWKISDNDKTATWFARNQYGLPDLASGDVKPIGAIAIIESTPLVELLEQPEFKYRWAIPDVAAHRARGAREQTLAQLEKLIAAEPATVTSMRSLQHMADVGDGRDVTMLDDEAVPFLPVLRFTDAGLTKFSEWEAVWAAQRLEDAGHGHATSPPPKYKSVDYQKAAYWMLRGKLDVPKERFISYPGCESDEDGLPVYGWAGWDHLQRAQALAALYLRRKDGEGWKKDRLTPMLAGLLELIPWVKQWHNEPSAEFEGLRMGDYFEQFLEAECRQHSLSHADLRAWRRPPKTRATARKTPKQPAAARAAASTDDPAAPAKPRRARKSKASPDAGADASAEDAGG